MRTHPILSLVADEVVCRKLAAISSRIRLQFVSVPEPASGILLGAGLAGLGFGGEP